MPNSARNPTPSPAPRGAASGVGAASISAVAARAGVSIATVSRVMNGVAKKASPDTVARVQRAVEELGYRPLGAGRALRRRESRLVAVLAANLANPAMAAIAAAAEAALRGAGYMMVLCDTHDEPALQDEYLLQMRAQYACGLVLLGAVDSPVLREFWNAREPLVFVNRSNPVGDGIGPYVGIDHYGAGRDVASWFVQRGWTDVALIHGRVSSSATADRVRGFQEELIRLNVALPAARVLTLANSDHLQIGYDSMQRILRHGLVQAVFCTGDLIAYGAFRAALEGGFHAGADYALFGFDDSPLNEWVAPWLNAVRVPYGEYGSAIVRALADGSSSDLRIVLPHQLVIRARGA